MIDCSMINCPMTNYERADLFISVVQTLLTTAGTLLAGGALRYTKKEWDAHIRDVTAANLAPVLEMMNNISLGFAPDDDRLREAQSHLSSFIQDGSNQPGIYSRDVMLSMINFQTTIKARLGQFGTTKSEPVRNMMNAYDRYRIELEDVLRRELKFAPTPDDHKFKTYDDM